MATLIICPVCETRYEVKAAFPPEGRKVRCSKCTHVWLAVSVSTAPQPQPGLPPRPQAPRAPAPQAPPPWQAAPARPAPPPPPPPRPAAAPPPGMAMRGPAGVPPAPRVDADYEVDESFGAQMGADGLAPPPPPPPSEKRAGLFGRLMGKRAPSAPHPQVDASFDEGAYAGASYPAGPASEEEMAAAALADPALVAAAFGEAPPGKAKRRRLPLVAIGWLVLALVVAAVVGLFVLAPNTVVSMLPGAARVYSLIGMPVGAQGLAFEGVHYEWSNDGSQTVLEVQGNVRNVSSSARTVPPVVIALRDEKGEEISEWTTEVSNAELAAGDQTAFLRQIPSPPSNVRSLKVRFAKAK